MLLRQDSSIVPAENLKYTDDNRQERNSRCRGYGQPGRPDYPGRGSFRAGRKDLHSLK